ncbi:uncharacterized protein LOC133307966 isoform X2 [Gastrolobium bilobum]|uniref:uncharacterized protein LOC133307966 isoform X2 n=1 Tax=Gastrolobium bilobum TaxID=150636 RepID=UPI002AB2E2AF|nr:uncharacterized protein LOC133307966 isoform X2 [Gastrolobium bilobum]
MVLATTNLVSCNFSILGNQKLRTSLQPHKAELRVSPNRIAIASGHFSCFKPLVFKTKTPFIAFGKMGRLHICQNLKKESEFGENGNGNGGGVVKERDWTTSILLFFFWAALLYYVFLLAPNQTPSRDMYFLRKLLNLKGDDGFRMNEVLVSLWYLMGLWPLAYSMLLIPTGRSNIPVWPFLVLSFFGGAYVLLPYFVLWKPPAPPVEKTQLKMWPLNFLESKVTAMILLAVGIALITYAGIAGEGEWKEFYQYFRESKFIHITSIDFTILSTFAPFWVYNDMTARKWFDKGSWLLPLSLIPFLGPGLYLLLRPSLSTMAISQNPVEPE